MKLPLYLDRIDQCTMRVPLEARSENDGLHDNNNHNVFLTRLLHVASMWLSHR